MRKHCLLIIILLLSCLWAEAQTIMEFRDKPFNFGAKVGFNASFPVINSLSLNGVEIEEVNVEYKVGYIAAVFCRINIERFFIQPSLAWHYSGGNILFSTPGSGDLPETDITLSKPITDQLSIKANSLEMPIMIGYNIVKQGPYGLSLMAGPKLKYNYKVSYESSSANDRRLYTSESTPFGVNIAAGVGVSIWRLFFDFVYEFGLNQVESDFKEENSLAPTNRKDISIDKRTNVMSISLGFLF